MEFIVANWEYFLLGFYVAEKIVKLTPPTLTVFGFNIGKYDDIVVDVAKQIITGLKKPKQQP